MADQDEVLPPEQVEVEISVAAHTIIVKAAGSLADVAAQALGLYEQTRLDAKRIPIGFDNAGGQVERAEAPDYSGLREEWGEDDRVGRKPA